MMVVQQVPSAPLADAFGIDADGNMNQTEKWGVGAVIGVAALGVLFTGLAGYGIYRLGNKYIDKKYK